MRSPVRMAQLVVLLCTLLAFSPAFEAEWLGAWDDNANFVDNPRWRGLGAELPSSDEARQEARAALRLVKRDAKRGRDKLPDDAPLGWAELLKRVFGVDGWQCPDCGKPMRLRTVVEGAPAALTITTSLLRSTGPPRPPAGGDGRGVHADA